MKSDEFLSELRHRGKKEEIIALAGSILADFQEKMSDSLDCLQAVREYTDKYVSNSDNPVNQLIILFWYFDFIREKPATTYLLTMLGTVNVLENQKERMTMLYGSAKMEEVFSTTHLPTLGSDLKQYPACICNYLENMSAHLSESECRKVLAGNHHGVDTKHFDEDKKLFAEDQNLEEFLQKKHERLIAELQSFADSGNLWYEQHITQDVVDYVKAHQEIQTGVIEGDHVIVAKIPYNPDAWLKENDPVLKRYYACHCPFVRESVLTSEVVPSLWCYCSGGYTKLFFDYLFDDDLEVELLESVLDGATTCRFSIRLPREYTNSVC